MFVHIPHRVKKQGFTLGFWAKGDLVLEKSNLILAKSIKSGQKYYRIWGGDSGEIQP